MKGLALALSCNCDNSRGVCRQLLDSNTCHSLFFLFHQVEERERALCLESYKKLLARVQTWPSLEKKNLASQGRTVQLLSIIIATEYNRGGIVDCTELVLYCFYRPWRSSKSFFDWTTKPTCPFHFLTTALRILFRPDTFFSSSQLFRPSSSLLLLYTAN